MCNGECKCKKEYPDELSRLEVLTDIVEFAKQQRAKGSPHTASWADYATVDKWMQTIGYLRSELPECTVKRFDDERKRYREFRARLEGTSN